MILKDLPTSLRISVKRHIFETLILNCDVFPNDNPGAITTIISKLQRRLIPKNEFIIR